MLVGVPRSEDTETATQRQERREGDEQQQPKDENLLERGIFEHPITGRVYEVMYVFLETQSLISLW
jgi:hypothetical protein